MDFLPKQEESVLCRLQEMSAAAPNGDILIKESDWESVPNMSSDDFIMVLSDLEAERMLIKKRGKFDVDNCLVHLTSRGEYYFEDKAAEQKDAFYRRWIRIAIIVALLTTIFLRALSLLQ